MRSTTERMANIIDQYVGARLRMIQTERSLSDRDLSEAMGVPIADLPLFANGEARISPEQLFGLFTATGIASTDLLPDSGAAFRLADSGELGPPQ